MGSYDLTNPQTMNRYAYAENNPASLLDPTGLFTCLTCDGGGGGDGGDGFDGGADDGGGGNSGNPGSNGGGGGSTRRPQTKGVQPALELDFSLVQMPVLGWDLRERVEM